MSGKLSILIIGPNERDHALGNYANINHLMGLIYKLDQEVTRNCVKDLVNNSMSTSAK